MPGALRASDLARKARQRLPKIAVVFASGYTENTIWDGGELGDGIDLLQKPYSRDQVARKLRSVLNKQKGPLFSGHT
jgi:two-component SAPR family response regulator